MDVGTCIFVILPERKKYKLAIVVPAFPKTQPMQQTFLPSMKMHLAQIFHFTLTEACYDGDGRFYRGPVNVTKSGIACQAWTSQNPHLHLRDPQVIPVLQVISLQIHGIWEIKQMFFF